MRSILRSAALVDAWLDTLRPEQQELARELRAAISAAAPELSTSIKWGNLMFTLDGIHAVAIVIHRAHANLQVFNGARLLDRFAQLEGAGKGVRHLKIRYRQPLDGALVRDLVHACIDEMRASVADERNEPDKSVGNQGNA